MLRTLTTAKKTTQLMATKGKNMSIIDQIIGYVLYLKDLIKTKIIGIVTYQRVYVNFLSVITHVLRNDYPIDAILRNGNHITLHNALEASFVTTSRACKAVKEDLKNDLITFSGLTYLTDRKSVKLHGSIKNGEVFGIFLDEIYGYLPVKGRTVIDVGASIGDSPIYFALRGADKVIGLEPYPKTYRMAKTNVEVNNLSDTITMLLAGCGAEQACITVNSDYESSIASSMTLENVLDENSKRDGENEIKVPLMTLENVLDENSKRDEGAILKMDCEGCEYDIILSASDDVLRRLSHIHIEYHYGYKNLKQRLEKCGFNVSVTRRPILHFNPENNKKMYIGDIFATLRTS